MKNSIKCIFAALAIAIAATACGGDRGGQHPDSLKADTSVMADSTKAPVSPAPGSNGSAISADTGLDRSGSGGTDIVKKP
ncbi:hypothetical protein [Mucilaginibacter gilvus]|uniref:Lipoprotein n=1 Tax=Mucilaginibacter gilvus TaxID=2305909 RepID=A0A444MMJ6_9SPHI|nr:hypothetical protein [Mucilaginibacter gilvus]RWY50935.1 hypothetical protein EPL05_12745 [Mucilaginibacter gilvus]